MAVFSAMAAAITALNVIFGSDPYTPQCQTGYDRLNVDLNMGARGDFVYLCYSRDRRFGDPITALLVSSTSTPQANVPYGYQLINVDLNKGAKGQYIYLMYTTDKSLGPPITDINVIYGDSLPVPSPPDWNKINNDLNEGAGGKYIYFIYKAATSF